MRNRSPSPAWKAATRRVRSAAGVAPSRYWYAMPAASSGLAQQRQEIDELAEHQRLVTVRDELGGEIGERLHLGADDAELGADEPRVAGRAAQPRELREDVEPRLARRFGRQRAVGVADRLAGATPRSAPPRPPTGATATSSSVRGGSSCSTCGLVRRSTNGRDQPPAADAARRDRGRARSASRSAR